MVHFSAVFLMLGSAFALYSIKYDTQQIEARLRHGERTHERLEAEIAALAAERAYLGRPERIQEIARRLGLVPIDAGQYARIEELRAARDIVTGTLAPKSSSGSHTR
jgi:cell division protein FtsL